MRYKLTIFCLLILLLSFVLSDHPLNLVVQAQEPSWKWILETRGKDFEIYVNSSDVTVKMHKNAPMWVWNGSCYVPYIYEYDDSKKCHCVWSGLISAKIYESGYAEFYDAKMTELRVKSEKWFLTFGKDFGETTQFIPDNIDVVQNSTGVYLNVSGTTSKPLGTFSITYCFRVGSTLKHEIMWSSQTTEQTVEVEQQWDMVGIDFSKIKTDIGDIIGDGLYDATWFEFLSPSDDFLLLENQRDMIAKLKPTEISFSGKKVTFTFSNWTLANGETLIIDPTTSTEKPSTAKNKAYWSEGGGEEEFSTAQYTSIQLDDDDTILLQSSTEHWFRFTFNVSEYNTGSNTIKYVAFYWDGRWSAAGANPLTFDIKLESGSWYTQRTETGDQDDLSGWDVREEYTDISDLPSNNIYEYRVGEIKSALVLNTESDAVKLEVIYNVTTIFTSGTADDSLQKSSGTSYADCQSATPTVKGESYSYILVGQYYDVIPTWAIWRGYISFNTSSIPDGATIQDAVLKLWMKSDFSDTDFAINVYDGTQPIWGDTVDAGDWGCGTNNEGTILNTANFVANGWVNISVGTSYINKQGKTQFELRSSREGTEPTGDEFIYIHSGDSSDDVYKPKLEVKHSQIYLQNLTGVTDLQNVIDRSGSTLSRFSSQLTNILSSLFHLPIRQLTTSATFTSTITRTTSIIKNVNQLLSINTETTILSTFERLIPSIFTIYDSLTRAESYFTKSYSVIINIVAGLTRDFQSIKETSSSIRVITTTTRKIAYFIKNIPQTMSTVEKWTGLTTGFTFAKLEAIPKIFQKTTLQFVHITFKFSSLINSVTSTIRTRIVPRSTNIIINTITSFSKSTPHLTIRILQPQNIITQFTKTLTRYIAPTTGGGGGGYYVPPEIEEEKLPILPPSVPTLVGEAPRITVERASMFIGFTITLAFVYGVATSHRKKRKGKRTIKSKKSKIRWM